MTALTLVLFGLCCAVVGVGLVALGGWCVMVYFEDEDDEPPS